MTSNSLENDSQTEQEIIELYDKHVGVSLNTPGVKDDKNKVMGALVGDFGLALLKVAELGTFGADKYTRGGWKDVPDGVQRYDDAMWRHLLKSNTEVIDPETGIEHEVAVLWNALAKLELKLRSQLDK